ncbi:MAG: glycosyltransferase family 1 protein [Acaryochloris sp. RU_4_1]|nr:glycosyltransferase family 1 protein [Acaryochloris sp. SU_5_25]NJM65307.1 glycosyltransferase family 1 protein [Acaryochloris sp. RU_4_1]NJR55180.1 glycosyltransferase family 1 protein [Acaryochloris sp. CRU_2_0]
MGLQSISSDQGRPERIALVSVHGDPAIEIGAEEAGGQNVYVRQVGEALAQLGWQVDMFTRQADLHKPERVQHQANCRTIRLRAGPTEFISRDEIFEYLPKFVDQLLGFQAQEGIQYPLVHTNYWLSSWVGMELKKHQPLAQVHTYHSLGAVKYDNVPHIPDIGATRLAVEKACLETAECVVATSPQEEEHMRSHLSTLGNVQIIPCGTDIKHYGGISRAEARQKLGIPLDAKVVFYIGRFDPRKGIETLVRAIAQSQFKTTDNLQLMIAGGSRPGNLDGQERNRIEGIVRELGLADITQFPGRISTEDLPFYYAAADVSVVPSHYEPFGLVAIEAMASLTPVVASDVGGLQFTVLPEETGLLVPPKDVAGFAQAIDRILADPQLKQQWGLAARKRVETTFSWRGVAQQLSQLYQQLLH